jgi:dipeptidyl aminopeptidase/acylaminoacyl peptidase
MPSRRTPPPSTRPPSRPRRSRAAPLTAERLWQIQRIGDLAASPDGRHVVCSVTTASLADNQTTTRLWRLETDADALDGARCLTLAGRKDAQPAWSPCGRWLAFVARREQEGQNDDTPQLYVLPAAGGEARRVGRFAPGIEAFRWLPDSRGLIFVSWVWPDARGAAAQARRHAEWAQRKSSGYASEEAQYRQWDRNLPQGRVPHLLRMDLGTGRVIDLFEGTPHELPRADPGLEHFDVSPDGRSLVFVADPAAQKRPDHRTALWRLDLRARRVQLLCDAAPWEFSGPRHSPDGRHLAVCAAPTGEHHTAFGQLAVFTLNDRGALRAASGSAGRRSAAHSLGTAVWAAPDVQRALHPSTHDVSGGLQWHPQGHSVFYAAEDRGRCPLWERALAPGSAPVAVSPDGGWVQGFAVLPHSERGVQWVMARDSAQHPVQVHHQVRGGAPRRLERFNDDLLASTALGELKEVTFTGALGDTVQMWLVFPPDFDASQRHPVLHVIHGGPYAAAGDTFGYRWNPHVLASRGHVVAMVNYHGSSGFGWPFRHAITGRLGELELQDIEAGTAWLRRQRWVDPKQIFASGGSYGGYLVAWMNGHCAPGRYRAYVCHAGVFDRVATWSADSYLQRHKDLGATYWADLPRVLAQSPATFAGRMRTPTLVIHGALDYRVPDTNGLAYYNTLKAQGVPARLLWFGDENHWVLKPANSVQWYGEFLEWLRRWGTSHSEPA